MAGVDCGKVSSVCIARTVEGNLVKLQPGRTTDGHNIIIGGSGSKVPVYFGAVPALALESNCIDRRSTFNGHDAILLNVASVPDIEYYRAAYATGCHIFNSCPYS